MVEQKAGREGLARENEERGLKELEARDADEGEERLRHKTASVTGAAMRSLADLSEVVGFFSYSRDDDEDSEGALLGLRDHIQRELRRQMGRSESDLRLWQEKMPIPGHGKLWENEIERAIAQSFFFIPIMTPRAVKSEHCRFQLRSFLAREAKLGRDDLIFPILYLRTPALEDEEVWRRDVALKTIVARQYTDLQNFRHYDLKQPVPRKIEFYCEHIVHALHESRMISR
jgi:hypothetical protein